MSMVEHEVSCDGSMEQIIIMGFAFFFIMGGYMPVQNFATSLLDTPCLPLGSISIGTIYACLALSSCAAPYFIKRLGPRKAMLCSALAYPIYIATVVYVVSPAVLVASLAIGLAGGVLNTANGVIIDLNSNEHNRGLRSGIFMSFNSAAGLPGNLISLAFLATPESPPAAECTAQHMLLLGWTPEQSPYFCVLVAVCAMGVFFLLCIKEQDPAPDGHNPNSNQHSAVGPADPTADHTAHPRAHPRALASSPWHSIMHVLRMCCSKRYRLVVLLSIYTGIGQAFWGGMFTRHIDHDWVGPVMAIVGVGEVAGGLICGSIVDRLGYPAAGATVLLTQAVALCTVYVGITWGKVALLMTAGTLLGAADSAACTLAYATLNCICSSSTAPASAKDALLFESDQVEEGRIAKLAPPPQMGPDEPWNEVEFDTYDAFGGFNAMQSMGTMIGFFYCAATASAASHSLFVGEMLFVLMLLGIALALLCVLWQRLASRAVCAN